MPLIVKTIKTPCAPKLSLGRLNVLVRPNNSGKSQTLRDIRDYVATGRMNRLIILNEIEVMLPPEAKATEGLRNLPHDTPGHVRYLGVISDLQNRAEISLPENWLNQQFEQLTNTGNLEPLLSHIGRFWVAHLDAESRLRLASPTQCYDLRTETPSNALQSFFAGGEKALQELRTAFKQAFAMDIALDWAAMQRWYLRIGAEFGEIPDQRKLLDD